MIDSPEQTAIYSFISSSPSSLFVNARAGSGKTTTLKKVLQYLPKVIGIPGETSNLVIAFNKGIVDTLVASIPEGLATIKTLHGLGYGAISSYLPRGSRLQVDNRKYGKLLFAEPEGERKKLQSIIGILRSLIADPDAPPSLEEIQALYLNSEFGEEISLSSYRTACMILKNGNAQVLQKPHCIDFDDMVYFPLVKKLPFTKYQNILVDESQDLSEANIATIKACSYPGRTRVIAFGDPNQAIYAFRGASHQAVQRMKETFVMDELPLSFSWRCSKRVVEKAQEIVPSIQHSPTAAEGNVSRISPPAYGLTEIQEWLYEKTGVLAYELAAVPIGTFQPVSAILCRNNAPLFSLAWQHFFSNSIPFQFIGRDFTSRLREIMKKNNLSKLTGERAKVSLDDWYEATAAKPSINMETLKDSYSALSFLVTTAQEHGLSLEDMLEQICPKNPTTDSSACFLSTIHKAKGMEWNTVYILNPELIPSKYAKTTEEIQQEQNLLYVAITRAKTDLRYISIQQPKWEKKN